MLASEHIKVKIRRRIVKYVVKRIDWKNEDSLGFVKSYDRAEIAKTNLWSLRAPSLSQLFHPLNSPLNISDASSTTICFIAGKTLSLMYILPNFNTQVSSPSYSSAPPLMPPKAAPTKPLQVPAKG